MRIKPIDLTRVKTIPLPARANKVPLDRFAQPPEAGCTCATHRIRRPYIVAFSRVSPNKNIPRLIQAFVRGKRGFKVPHQLVLVGSPPAFALDPMGCDAVTSTGYLARDQVRAVLSGAELLIFPSFYEGFGLPVLEAMSCGVAVACSGTASLPEVAGAAAVFFDPYSVDDIAEKIALVVQNRSLRDGLRRKGYENARRFSWEKTARETQEVYRRVYIDKR